MGDKKNIREILSNHPFKAQNWWASVHGVLNKLEIPDPSKSSEENDLNSFLYSWIAFELLSERDKIEFIKNSSQFQEFINAMHQFAMGISETTAKTFFEELEKQVVHDKQMFKKR